MQRRASLCLVTIICLITSVGSGVAQDLPRRPLVLSRAVLDILADEVNGYAAFNSLRVITTYHRFNGSNETDELIERLRGKLESYGLDPVIDRVPIETGYEFIGLKNSDGVVPMNTRSAELRLVEPYPKLIATTERAPSALIYGSLSADVTTELVYVGDGVEPESYEGKDVRGKIVLVGVDRTATHFHWPMDIKEVAVHQYGAAGILHYFDRPHNSGDNDDANLNDAWSPRSKDGTPSTFGFTLSNNQYRFLRSLLDSGERVVVRAKVDAQVKQGDGAFIELLHTAIVGSEHPEQEFFISAHLDHAMPGAVDNGSGCAAILEMARTLQALIDNDIIPRPKRTIRFLWLPHVVGLDMYFELYPEMIGKVEAAMSVDSVGVDQTVFSSFFTIAEPSYSLPSYWNTVVRSLAEHLRRRTTRDVLNWSDTDNLYAPEGSRDQFNVRVSPYRGASDSFQTNNSHVRAPTIALGTSPAPPRHSQVNFLSYIDPTGLHRAAYIGAALAMVFGWTDASNVGRLLDEVYYGGRTRLLDEARRATAALAAAEGGTIDEAFRRGSQMLKYGGYREVAMLESIRELEPALEPSILQQRQRQASDAARALQEDLRQEYERHSRQLGHAPAEKAGRTPREVELAGLVPSVAPGVRGSGNRFMNYYEKVFDPETIASYDLAPNFDYMHFGYMEARNLIDGNRSILEIYETAMAELWSGGYPVDHDLTLEEVARYMRFLEADDYIRIEPRPSVGGDDSGAARSGRAARREQAKERP